MNRRLRKKKHKGEFNYKGFEVTCKFEPELDEQGVDFFLDSFIEYVESVGLGCGGGLNTKDMGQHIARCAPCHRKRNGKIHYKSDHCTENDRQSIKKWLEDNGAKQIVVGSLFPAWG